VTGAFYIRSQNRVARQVDYKLQELVAARVVELSHHLEAYGNILYSTRGLLAVSDATDDAWDRFISSQSLASRYPGIQAVAYAEVVAQTDIAAYEKRMKALLGNDYEIHPRKDNGDYVLITFHKETSAIPSSQQSLGLDIASDSVRRKALDTATKTGAIAATQPIELATLQRFGLLLVTPVTEKDGNKSDKPFGYTVAIFSINDLINASMKEQLNNSKYSIYIADVTDGEAIPVYEKVFKMSGQIASRSVLVDVADRQWRVTLHAPTSSLLTVTERFAPLFILIVGFSFMLLVCFFIYTVRLRRRLYIG
jgi:CHASE1-domain containing sensor protein